MAILTSHFERFRPVRQTAVTALARGVSGVGGDLLNARCVTRLASATIRELEREVMRPVTLCARDLAVRRVIGTGELVARAARSRRHQCGGAGGVRIVTSDTRTLPAWLRMVRMHGLMAVRAGSGGRGGHVVGRVATAALSVCRNLGATEHVLLVTRAAGYGLFLLEPMGLMTTRALTVPVLEQGCRGHSRRLNGVARDAGGARFARVGVQVLMARRAGLRRGLPFRGMGGFDVRVATVARCRLRLLIFVGPVAIDARLIAVSFHCGRACLGRRVATFAVSGGIRHEPEREPAGVSSGPRPRGLQSLQRLFVTAALDGECMTRRAVGLDARSESLLGLAARMSNVRFALVATGAGLGSDGAHHIAGHRVTFRARQFRFGDVDAMATDGPGRRPRALHVEAGLAHGIIGARDEDRRQHGDDQHPRRHTALAVHAPAMLVGSHAPRWAEALSCLN